MDSISSPETPAAEGAESEVLILPDGRVQVRNLTPGLARVLAQLAPEDEVMRRRAGISGARQFLGKGNEDS